jgi:aryl-alcohol dehydrogenase-like predicted oxidoreductase
MADPQGRAGLGLGMAALGRPAYINLGHDDDVRAVRDVDALEARAHQVLDAAWDLGIRHLDAARSYGLGERFLGSWLAEHPGRRTAITVGSKWGYTYVADWRTDVDVHEVKDHSVATFERQWPETLAALGSAPDLYLIHSVTPDSPALSDQRLLAKLGALASTGVRVGLSTSGPGQADVLGRALQLDGAPFTAVQATWNVLETSVGAALAEARDRGWHVALKETVANGRLTDRGDVPAVMRSVAEAHGCSVDAVAMAAAMAAPAAVVLSGAATTDQLVSNARAREVVLTADELASLGTLAEGPGDYWSARSDLPWI